MSYYLDVLYKYAVFSGRATRSEYWWFQLFSFLIVLVMMGGAIFFAVQTGQSPYKGIQNADIMVRLYSLATLLPTIAVQVRRLHDIGYTGWWILLGLTGIGWFVLWVLACYDSQPGTNEYGPNPKETEAFSAAT